jgi:hypothetical protein
MQHELYDIWEVELTDNISKVDLDKPWKVQLIKYVANFPTQGAAQRYVNAVKAERKKQGLK